MQDLFFVDILLHRIFLVKSKLWCYFLGTDYADYTEFSEEGIRLKRILSDEGFIRFYNI